MDKELVSRLKRLDNIAKVSVIFSFSFVEAFVEIPKAVIRADNDAVSSFILLVTNAVVATLVSELDDKGVLEDGLPINLGEVIVLFVKVSIPSLVAKVPDVGKVILLIPVVVSVRSPIPFTDKLFDKVIIFPVLSTPVPPFDEGSIVVIEIAESERDALDENKA